MHCRCVVSCIMVRDTTRRATMIASAYPTLESFFADCYRPRCLLACSPRTLRHYGVAIRHLDRFFGRKATLEDVADEDRLVEFMDWFSEGRASATLAKQRAHVMSLLTFAHRRGMIPSVPNIRPIRLMHRAPDSYSTKEITRLLKAAGAATGEISGIPAAHYWLANVLVVFNTGVRTSALFGIRITDINLTALSISFPPENQKNRRGQTLRVTAPAARAVERIYSTDRRMLFPEPWCEATRYNRIRRLFKAAGLPCGGRDLYQKLRRTTATLMHQAGHDATTQLGHSSDAVTRKYYLDTSLGVQAADVLPVVELPESDPQQRLF